MGLAQVHMARPVLCAMRWRRGNQRRCWTKAAQSNAHLTDSSLVNECAAELVSEFASIDDLIAASMQNLQTAWAHAQQVPQQDNLSSTLNALTASIMGSQDALVSQSILSGARSVVAVGMRICAGRHAPCLLCIAHSAWTHVHAATSERAYCLLFCTLLVAGSSVL